MPTSFLEIIELPNGDYALRRSDDDKSPLVKISFSREAREMLQDNELEVAKAMIAAGIEAVGTLSDEFEVEAELEPDSESESEEQTHTLH
ncbi:hypothetical protein [Hydrocarboniclastica marina]|uniref:Uncharacterized protein n=1 Tax=Hydrocarboniclastica marina TaxID=2259620 RepID=A0A4P7XFI8_9ALTE|nr:hypothetical protein [Hydrocarboniclastica marina]MAL98531.1 hypothetical protein [Alteromonadaceae bacterium]QCF25718.1 hypothetical protein soil367_07180 [Hydrocarboniclastica marina]|tara:strand:+ start:429 stop:698 length:270 start_codon:yes stop_codon:yes gene_type:complete